MDILGILPTIHESVMPLAHLFRGGFDTYVEDLFCATLVSVLLSEPFLHSDLGDARILQATVDAPYVLFLMFSCVISDEQNHPLEQCRPSFVLPMIGQYLRTTSISKREGCTRTCYMLSTASNDEF